MAYGDPYISRAQLKNLLGITHSSEDDNIDRAVMGATRAINNKSGYSTFWNTVSLVTISVETSGRLVPKRADGYWKLLLPDGIASATGLAVAGVTSGVRGLDVRSGRPIDAIRLPMNFTMTETLDVTAIWGWPSLPDDIVMACQMQAHRYYKRRGSPEGMAGSAEWGVTRIPYLDPDVKQILENGGYMSPGIG